MVCCAGQVLCLAVSYMVSPVDKVLAQVTAHKACSTSNKHTVAFNTWLGFEHWSPGKSRCLCRTLHIHTAWESVTATNWGHWVHLLLKRKLRCVEAAAG
jgi:hypothetical protein